jgi:Proteins of 100 residues with WXG
MAIAMDEGKVEAARSKVMEMHADFEAALQTARGAVEALFDDRGLEGQAANAFRGRFDEAEQTFKNQVLPQIEGIATMLNSIKDGLEQSDLSIAQGIGGS